MKGRDTCILSACSDKITGRRYKWKYNTCSPECAYIHNLNVMAGYRAKERGYKTKLCEVKTCSRIFTVLQRGVDKCNTCRGVVPTRKPGRRKKGKRCNEQIARKHSAVSFHDFRATICHRNKLICRNIKECSDTLAIHKNGRFKYQINGGVNCWEKPEDNAYTVGCNCALAGVSSVNIRG